MRDFASGIVDDIASFFAGLPGKALTAARDLGANFLSGLKTGFAKLSDDLISLVVNPINAVLKLWNGLSIPGFNVKLPSVDTHIPGVGKVGGETLGWGGFDLPDVGLLPTKLAAGGIVTAPTFALVGEAGPEAVVPLDRWNGGGITINLHFAKGFMTGSPRAIANELSRPIADALERLGPGMALPAT